MAVTPDTPLLEFTGVGEQRFKKLEKLGLTKADDLLAHYPRDYEDRRKIYTIREAPPGQRICISAIALETLSAATAALTAAGCTAEVCQIAVSRTRPAGRLHLLTAANPVFLITARREGDGA